MDLLVIYSYNILGLLEDVLGCGSQPSPPPSQDEGVDNNTQVYNNLSGWGMPELGRGQNWDDVIEYYKKVLLEKNDADDKWKAHFESGYKPESFPKDWAEYGAGSGGYAPPPWARLEGHYGRPDFCFLFPAVGNCSSHSYRWGYNPEAKACQTFLYSGCGGNGNNFLHERECKEACVEPTKSPCEPHDRIKFEDLQVDLI